MGLNWDEIEAQRDELEKQFPGWHFWPSPSCDPLNPGTRWNAQPWPVIHADSVEEMTERIRSAHAGLHFPVLAPPRSYLARVRKLREHEEHVRIAWQRARARPRRRRRQQDQAAATDTGDVFWPA